MVFAENKIREVNKNYEGRCVLSQGMNFTLEASYENIIDMYFRNKSDSNMEKEFWRERV